MSKMMDVLHEIRERHHKRVKDLPLREREVLFPRKCKHCGQDLAPAGGRAAGSPPAEGYQALEITGFEDGKATVVIQSPPCPKCARRSIFEIACERS